MFKTMGMLIAAIIFVSTGCNQDTKPTRTKSVDDANLNSERSTKLFNLVTVSGSPSEDANFVTVQVSPDWFLTSVRKDVPLSVISPVVGLRGATYDKLTVNIPFARDLIASSDANSLAVAVTNGSTSIIFPFESKISPQKDMNEFVKVFVNDDRTVPSRIALAVVKTSVNAPRNTQLRLNGDNTNSSPNVLSISFGDKVLPNPSMAPDSDTCGKTDPSSMPPSSTPAPVTSGSDAQAQALALVPENTNPPPFALYKWGACQVNNPEEKLQLDMIRKCYELAQTPPGTGGGYPGNVMGNPKCTDVAPYVNKQVKKCVNEQMHKLGLGPLDLVFEPCSVFRHGWISDHEFMGICRKKNPKGSIQTQLCGWTDPWQGLDGFYQPGTGGRVDQVWLNL